VWEIAKTFREDMRVAAGLSADEDLLGAALLDNSIVQLVNTATLPGVMSKHAWRTSLLAFTRTARAM